MVHRSQYITQPSRFLGKIYVDRPPERRPKEELMRKAIAVVQQKTPADTVIHLAFFTTEPYVSGGELQPAALVARREDGTLDLVHPILTVVSVGHIGRCFVYVTAHPLPGERIPSTSSTLRFWIHVFQCHSAADAAEMSRYITEQCGVERENIAPLTVSTAPLLELPALPASPTATGLPTLPPAPVRKARSPASGPAVGDLAMWPGEDGGVTAAASAGPYDAAAARKSPVQGRPEARGWAVSKAGPSLMDLELSSDDLSHALAAAVPTSPPDLSALGSGGVDGVGDLYDLNTAFSKYGLPPEMRSTLVEAFHQGYADRGADTGAALHGCPPSR